MKRIVFDSPFHAKGAVLGLPAAGIKVINGEAQTVDDASTELALSNAHVRLESDKETPYQREFREKSEAQEIQSAAASDVAKQEATVPVAAASAPVSAATTKI